MPVVRCDNLRVFHEHGKKRTGICGNILFEGQIIEGHLKIICHKCKGITEIKVRKKHELVLAKIGTD